MRVPHRIIYQNSHVQYAAERLNEAIAATVARIERSEIRERSIREPEPRISQALNPGYAC
jgi:hypothetical protein